MEEKLSQKKVLVIEDDPFLSQLLINRLREMSVDVLHSTDGNEGLSAIKTNSPDLVILDLILPEKPGFEVLEEVHNDPVLHNIPIVIFSNLGQDIDIQRGKELGAIGYFIKAKTPIDNIITEISNILSAR